MVDVELLRERTAAVLPEIVEFRHALHRDPETGFSENETAAKIRAALAGTRAEVLPPIVGTDVVALVRGGLPGRTILLRADIDALPVSDRSGRAWSSARPGVSHACGHDGHAAMLVGAAKVLDGLAPRLQGNVRLVFQPAEEGEGGGKRLVKEGLLDIEPRPEAALALHGWPGLPQGSIGAASGPVMAAVDWFVLTVKGSGGHGALPHKATDPVHASAQLVTALQSVVSRSVDPLAPAVLSVCSIHGGRTSNVIPDTVTMEGTVRYYDGALHALIRDRIESLAAGVCGSLGCTHELDYREGYIALANDPGMVGFARGVVERCLGPGAWNDSDPRTMGGEDFSYFLRAVPGALLRLGLGEGWPRLHTPEFDFNDGSLAAGILFLAAAAVEFCAGGAS
jgi:amidohydrolase